MIDVRPATGADWTVIAWLWQAYRNDLSAIVDGLPREDGRFNHAWLDGWADSDDAAGYLVREGDAPASAGSSRSR